VSLIDGLMCEGPLGWDVECPTGIAANEDQVGRLERVSVALRRRDHERFLVHSCGKASSVLMRSRSRQPLRMNSHNCRRSSRSSLEALRRGSRQTTLCGVRQSTVDRPSDIGPSPSSFALMIVLAAEFERLSNRW
jgi:hypothetical protein